MAFGTHVTPMPRETLRPYPALDFVLRGEPELTLRELVDHLEGNQFSRPENIETLFKKHDAAYEPRKFGIGEKDYSFIRGWSGASAARWWSTRIGRSSPTSTTCRCRCTTCCRSTSTGCR